jgi:hypothetical protein
MMLLSEDLEHEHTRERPPACCQTCMNLHSWQRLGDWELTDLAAGFASVAWRCLRCGAITVRSMNGTVSVVDDRPPSCCGHCSNLHNWRRVGTWDLPDGTSSGGWRCMGCGHVTERSRT